MTIKADYHTHSTYSRWYHAYNTIDQMAQKAKLLGLNEIAITDHGPKHMLFGIRPKNIDKAISDAKKATKKHNISVLCGIEANITGLDGTIDLTDEQISKLDILLMGYHKGTKCDFIKYFFNPHRNSAQQIEKNTQAYVNAINRYNIAIVTHLNEYIKVDLKRVAKVCAQNGTLIEFNRKHNKFTDADAQILIDSGANFVLSSDAHKKSKIADCGTCMDYIKRNNIPLDRVKNLNGTVEFLKPNQNKQKERVL